MSDLDLIKKSAAFPSSKAARLDPAVLSMVAGKVLGNLKALDPQFAGPVGISKDVFAAAKKDSLDAQPDSVHRPAAAKRKGLFSALTH